MIQTLFYYRHAGQVRFFFFLVKGESGIGSGTIGESTFFWWRYLTSVAGDRLCF